MKLTCLRLLMVSVLATLLTMSSADLQYDFYNSSCPNAETTIRNVVYSQIDANPSVAAALIRLLFHDCFVRGCDASILLDPSSANPSPEKSVIPLAQAGYQAVDQIKAAVEAVCPGKVSCADIIAFAARDSVNKSAGFSYAVPAGRRDGSVSTDFSLLTNMPSPSFGIADLVGSFKRKNLDVDDLVTLSGAHTIGVSHCSSFTNRLYPSVDPAMDAGYAADLKVPCPAPPGRGVPDNLVNNSAVITTPMTFDNQFYKNALARRVLFTSDAALMTRNDTVAKVTENAADLAAWKVRFAASMVKMGNIEVLTGTQGQVRKYCRAIGS
ncbi:peroxidase 2 [Brachypodium distachyon]|uniref:Peroxidase n=1 Tax=Brachypodium distachyon TaxID=15368 RepID=I1HER5_BRADI|nr:peroxidase 2 [Brachypodium distachyon]KQK04038.1 hypothetical protein BRADI_2g11300v3 [Brachypodium distachyon]|eukprot:XP_003565690.1 peroxidase 2 [Brachypodium distachyon]